MRGRTSRVAGASRGQTRGPRGADLGVAPVLGRFPGGLRYSLGTLPPGPDGAPSREGGLFSTRAGASDGPGKGAREQHNVVATPGSGPLTPLGAAWRRFDSSSCTNHGLFGASWSVCLVAILRVLVKIRYMTIRDEADELLDEFDLFEDPDKPMETLAAVAEALDVPVHAARQVASALDVPMVGATFALTRDRALDLAEQLDAEGWQLGPEEEEDEDLGDEEEGDEEDGDEDD